MSTDRMLLDEVKRLVAENLKLQRKLGRKAYHLNQARAVQAAQANAQADAVVDKAVGLFRPGLYRYDGTGFEPVEEAEQVARLRRQVEALEADVEARRTVYRKVGGLLGCCATGPDILAAIERETEQVADLKRHAELLKADVDERNERIRQLEEVNEERFQRQREVEEALAKAARELHLRRDALKDANDGLKHDLQALKDELDRLTSANAARCEQASKAEERVRELEKECGKWTKRSAQALAGEARAVERMRELEAELHEKRMHWIPGPNVSAKVAADLPKLDVETGFADAAGPDREQHRRDA